MELTGSTTIADEEPLGSSTGGCCELGRFSLMLIFIWVAVLVVRCRIDLRLYCFKVHILSARGLARYTIT